MFSEVTMEKIGYYVYCLVDPRTNEIFYIGKGKDNRVYTHVREAKDKKDDHSNKLDLIREIQAAGMEVEHYIIRYGLEESVALEVEAALIDGLGLDCLQNEVKGHHVERGKISCEELEIKIGAQEAHIVHDVLVIKINQLYRRDMTVDEMYEATRKYWRLSKANAKKVTYVLAVVNGIIRGVFEPEKWIDDERAESLYKPKRVAFEGCPAPKDIWEHYVGKTINHYSKAQGQNPIVYLFEAVEHTEKERKVLEAQVEQENRENQEFAQKTEEIKQIDEKVITIKINKEYREGMSKEELFKVTSYCWSLSIDRAKKADYVLAVVQGEVKEVYENLKWYEVEEKGRIAFRGQVAHEEIREKYVGKNVRNLYKQGEANPCKYFNI